MITLLNPGKKRRKRSKRRSCPTASVAGRAAVKRWACSSRRIRSLPAADVQRLCASKRSRSRKPRWIPGTIPAGGWKYNGRRRRRRNTSWVPAYARNGIVADSTSAFSVSKLSGAAPIVGGFLGARLVSDFISRQGFLPSFLRSGPGNILVDLVGAGLVTGLAKVGAPSYTRAAKVGGSVFVMTKIIWKYVMPMVAFTPLKGLADYLTVGGAAGARPLMGLSDDELDGLAGDYDGLDAMQDVAGEELEAA